ncbi:hypothetical protein BUALT_Bualt14G0108000 [Buddleja alternifolia]|uniref:Uncharacterized protein n=1 Tax=Buddleja alternifolia TaxID=168488 RepID=A0AAV6WS03_9LAMI|nr:hypothetical protein BUALT_Bualt14G0108000 [Buddleja alternifolia]
MRSSVNIQCNTNSVASVSFTRSSVTVQYNTDLVSSFSVTRSCQCDTNSIVSTFTMYSAIVKYNTNSVASVSVTRSRAIVQCDRNSIISISFTRVRTQTSLLASLPRGPVPKSGGSPCTYIPGRGSGSCKLNEKHFFGGGSAHVPPASPRAGIASVVAKDKVVKDFAS